MAELCEADGVSGFLAYAAGISAIYAMSLRTTNEQ